VHAHEESANSWAASLSLLEAGLTSREVEVREQGLRLQEEQLPAHEDRLNREREALKSRESMASQTITDLAQCQETL
jgi:hypothetical protein